MQLIALHPEDLVILLEQSHLPKRSYFRLTEGERYGFYTHTKVYGIYLLKRTTKQFYYLRKNAFRPLQLFAPVGKNINQTLLSDPSFLLKTWVNRNRFRDKVLLIQNSTPKHYTLTLYHDSLPEFNFTVKVARSTKLTQLLKEINTVFYSESQGDLAHLTSLGKDFLALTGWNELFTLFNNRSVYYETQPFGTPLLPLEVLYKDDFLVKHTILQQYHKQEKAKTRLSRFSLITSDEDKFMQTEKKNILQVFDKKKYFAYDAHTLSGHIASSPTLSKTITETITTTEVLHLIAHGKSISKDFYFQLGGQPLFGLSSLNKIKSTPQLVVISACESKDQRLLDFFFTRGTQTIITTRGLLFSKNLAETWAGFYQRLLVDKLTVKESFALMLRRLSQLNDINAVKLSLHGYAKEKLHSFK